MRAYTIELILVATLAAAVSFFGYLGYGLLSPPPTTPRFSGERALQNVATQLEFGPRTTGSSASEEMTEWLIDELRSLGWDVAIQPFLTVDGIQARNIIAVPTGTDELENPLPVTLVGSHYDSRLMADQDENEAARGEPVAGANSGASGSAVLLELARSLDVSSVDGIICLGFFDAGANAGIGEWTPHMGSQYFVEFVEQEIPTCANIREAVLLGEVGDVEQLILEERNSSPALADEIWDAAAELEYDEYISSAPMGPVVSDQIPFLQRGIPAVLMTDADYPELYTSADTFERISARSLERVGRTLQVWLQPEGEN